MIRKTNKKKPQEHHDLKSTTDSTRNRSQNKNVERMGKSKWKKQMKEKIEKLIEERKKQEMINKTKTRTIIEEKWGRQKFGM